MSLALITTESNASSGRSKIQDTEAVDAGICLVRFD